MKRYTRLYEASPVAVLQKLEPEDIDTLQSYYKSLITRIVTRKMNPNNAKSKLRNNLKDSYLDDVEIDRALYVFSYLARLVKSTMQKSNVNKTDEEGVKGIVTKIFENPDWLKIAEEAWMERNQNEGIEDTQTPILESSDKADLKLGFDTIKANLEKSKEANEIEKSYKEISKLKFKDMSVGKRIASLYLYMNVDKDLKLDSPEDLRQIEKSWMENSDEYNDSKMLKDIKSGVTKETDTNRKFLSGDPIKVVDLEDKSKIKPEVRDELIDLLNSEFPESNAEMLKKDDAMAALGIPIYRFRDEDGKTFDVSLYPAKGKGINVLGAEKLSSKLNLAKNFFNLMKTNKWTTALSDNLPNWLKNGVVGRNAGQSKLHKTIAYAISKPEDVLGKIAKLIGAGVPTPDQIVKRVKRLDTKDEAGF